MRVEPRCRLHRTRTYTHDGAVLKICISPITRSVSERKGAQRSTYTLGGFVSDSIELQTIEHFRRTTHKGGLPPPAKLWVDKGT